MSSTDFEDSMNLTKTRHVVRHMLKDILGDDQIK